MFLGTEGIAQGIVWMGVERVEEIGYVGPLCSCWSMLADALGGDASLLLYLWHVVGIHI